MLQVADLQYASPATVSRCGMVYVDPKNLRYTPYWQRWVNNRPGKVLKKKNTFNVMIGLACYLTTSQRCFVF